MQSMRVAAWKGYGYDARTNRLPRKGEAVIRTDEWKRAAMVRVSIVLWAVLAGALFFEKKAVAHPPPGMREVPDSRKNGKRRRRRRRSGGRRRLLERLRARALRKRIAQLKRHLPQLKKRVAQVRRAQKAREKLQLKLTAELLKKIAAAKQMSGKKQGSMASILRGLAFTRIAVSSPAASRDSAEGKEAIYGDHVVVSAKLNVPRQLVKAKWKFGFSWTIYGIDAFGRSAVMGSRRLYGGAFKTPTGQKVSVTSSAVGLGLVPGNYMLEMQLWMPKGSKPFVSRFVHFRVDRAKKRITAAPVGTHLKRSAALKAAGLRLKTPGTRRLNPNRFYVRLSYRLDRSLYTKGMSVVVGATAENVGRNGRAHKVTLFRHLDKPEAGLNVFGRWTTTRFRHLKRKLGTGRQRIVVYVAAFDGKKVIYSERTKTIRLR
jgi:murein DD-endopeptidase MepM/ murein hydrolase activator NlpD